ncbi:MAG: class I SAM-dependent methyltransferase [Patescibacteria group bacterium]
MLKIYKKIDKSLFPIKLWLDMLVDPVCKVIDRSGSSILDVGCGQGYPMRLIRMVLKPDYVVGVDLFEKYISQARRSKLHDKYVLSDIRKMKFPARSFDIVIASHVIEHLPPHDATKFIKDLERIAKKQVIIATPIGEMYHPAVDGNKLQLHLSHFFPKDFKRLGYKTLKYGNRWLLGEVGLVHRVKSDLIKKLLFLFNIVISPLYYWDQTFADYVFVAYKKINVKKSK